jgi:hypothetical protein
VLSDGEAGSSVIGHKALLSIHLLQRQSVGSLPEPVAILPEQRPFQFAGAFHLPEGIPAMLDSIELVESTHPRQQGTRVLQTMNPEEHMVADYAGTGMTATVRNPLKTRAKLREGNTSLKVEGESPDWPSDQAAAFSTTKSVGQQHFVDSAWISG